MAVLDAQVTSHRVPAASEGFDVVLVVVLTAIGAAVALAVLAATTVAESDRGSVITGALSVIGTIVGAFFGHKVGSSGKEAAETERRAESLKVEELLARVTKDDAQEALGEAAQRFAAQ
jgi:hypothetical protein